MAINNLSNNSTENSVSNPENSQINQKIKKGSFLNVILAILLMVLVAAGTLMFFQKDKVLANTNQLELDIKNLNVQVEELKQNKVVVSKTAADALVNIAKDELRWSDIIAEINKLLPVDASGGKKIKVLSYSGAGDGKIALNMVTVAAALPPYDDVSRLIATFNSSVFFKDAYVPSISKGTNAEGNTTLSFVLNLAYQKPETGSVEINLNNAVSPSIKTVPVLNSSANTPNTVVNTTETTKVPRSN